jgi:hypothetical protein
MNIMLLQLTRRYVLDKLLITRPQCETLRKMMTTKTNDDYKIDNDDDDDNDEFSNYEDLMAMEDSYGSGVSASEQAANEANAKLLDMRKRLLEEHKRRGIQKGDRVKVLIRRGAPYPERNHRSSEGGLYININNNNEKVLQSGLTAASATTTDMTKKKKKIVKVVEEVKTTIKEKRYDIRPAIGYVVDVRNDRVGVKRCERIGDTDLYYPTFPKGWVEQLDIGEMWEMNTGSRFQNTYGSFASSAEAAIFSEQNEQQNHSNTSTNNSSSSL